ARLGLGSPGRVAALTSYASSVTIAPEGSITSPSTTRSTTARTSTTPRCRLRTRAAVRGRTPTTPNTKEFPMALLAPYPPHQAAEAIQSTFGALAEHRTFRSPALRKATGPLQLVEPHQVFTLGLHDLVAGRGLEAAKSTGWLYLVQEGDKVLASAEAVRTGT